MVHRIEVGFKGGIKDASGGKLRKKVIEELAIPVESARTVEVYSIDAALTSAQFDLLAINLFCDPVTQEFAVDAPLARNFDWLIELGLKPGVTDNVAKTAKEAIEGILKIKLAEGEAVYTSRQYLISGKSLIRANIEKIASGMLANDLVQRWSIFERVGYSKGWESIAVPKISLAHEPGITAVDLNVSDEELEKISRDRKLALNLAEMREIKKYFLNPDVARGRREVGMEASATDAELEALGQSWSEHCKHKIFNARINYYDGVETVQIDGLFDFFIKNSTKKLQTKIDWIASAFWDNSGVMRFNDDWLLAVKCETHNSPSNEEPYGGALTGIVGVYRDPMGTGMGCKLIFGTFGFCTGSPFYKGDLRPKIHPRRLLEGVRQGVQDGGNKHGVPTPYGITFFDDGYMAKPAIFVSAAGLIPAQINGQPGQKKNATAGDFIVMCGGRVGIDGIHGATESSMEAGDWISASHVQIGDPFTQKIMHDFLIEARDAGLYEGITDNGAGGLSSSVGEMAQYSNGFELWLDKVPLKYAGLDPWQILVSESQERMTLAVSAQKLEQFMALAKTHDVLATAIGKFNSSGKFHSTYQGKPVTFLDMDFVHNGVPRMELEAEWISPQDRGLREPEFESIGDNTHFLKEMLSRPNICGKEYINRQYDHEVQATSVVKPLVGRESDVYSDAAVIRPLLGSDEGVAICAAINPDYGRIDAYWMAAMAIDEAVRKIVAVGGSFDQIAFNDNFCWPSPLPAANNPDARFKLAQLVRANLALYDMTLAFGTPLISGKDSMTMDGTLKDVSGSDRRISAPATLQISAVGKINDIKKCVTMDSKNPGDLVYILGITRNELGGSEYYLTRGKVGLHVPKVDAQVSARLCRALSGAIGRGLVKSCHGVYKGGLAVALAQSAFAGDNGMEINLAAVPVEDQLQNEKILYSESAGRFIVTIAPANVSEFENELVGNIFKQIGKVSAGRELRIFRGNKTVVKEDVCRLKKSWQRRFRNF
jgi:phosphoribosylformylglycinamidine synthase